LLLNTVKRHSEQDKTALSVWMRAIQDVGGTSRFLVYYGLGKVIAKMDHIKRRYLWLVQTNSRKQRRMNK
jgi:hypothetical protein